MAVLVDPFTLTLSRKVRGETAFDNNVSFDKEA